MPSFWTSCLDFVLCRSRQDPSDEQFRKGKEAFGKFKTSRVPKDLDNAIGYFDLALNNRRTSLDGSGPPHADLDLTLTTYASALFARYQIKPSPSDLQRVIALDEEAFKLYEDTSDTGNRPTEYTKLLLNLGDAYFHLYDDTHAAGSFEKAIEKYDQLLQSLNASPELKRKGGMKMAIALTTWCDKEESATPREKKNKLEQAIELFEEAKDATGKEQSAEQQDDESRNIRERCLFNLAIAHNARYLIEKDLTGLDKAIVDLDKAIQYNREAREMLLQSRHPELMFCLFDLAQQLFAKYEYERGPVQPQLRGLSAQQHNGLGELLEAKKYAQEALDLKEINDKRHATLKVDLKELLDTVEEHSKPSLQRSQHSLTNPQTLLVPMALTHSSNVSLANTGSSQHSLAHASSHSNQVVDG